METQLIAAHKHCENTLQAWKKTLNDVLSSVDSLFDPTLSKLPPQIKRLIILPTGGLFLLPLHAIPLRSGQLLCQRYCISYAPSIQILREMQNKAKTIKGKGLYAVINSEEDPALVFSEFEAKAISRSFQSCQVNIGEIATKEFWME